MIVLVSGATATMRELADPKFGVLFVPDARNSPDTIDGGEWAIDNGAYSGLDAPAFMAMLQRFIGRPGCRFVAAPDVVGDSDQTLALFRWWSRIIRALGFPVALVAQNGLTADAVPWDRADAIFVGGAAECAPCEYVRPVGDYRERCPRCARRLSEWKLGPAARDIVEAAKARGLWVHMGRVNTRQRLRYAEAIGCDSVDGSGFSKWSRKRLPLAARWLDEFAQQPELTHT